MFWQLSKLLLNILARVTQNVHSGRNGCGDSCLVTREKKKTKENDGLSECDDDDDVKPS